MDMDLSYIPELQSSDTYEQITAPGELDERTNSLRFQIHATLTEEKRCSLAPILISISLLG
jgi:hypothetical protein